ncbi:DNA adenine methylase [Sphingobacterium spiritivorum]|uniref:DNA adenine methylase n=1 Tax=Sphingobacterium spiritivorum TaxID=258 RepID=UPI003DA560FC
MSHNSSKLIAFNYFGGKHTWCDSISAYFPEHIHFIDVFCGSMAITLNKPFSQIDTANDINGDVVHFFKILRDHPDELIRQLLLTPCSREEYNNSWGNIEGISDIERARRFYIRVRQSFYGLGIQRQNKGWHAVKTVSRSQFGETVNKWLNSIPKLFYVAEKLMHIQIENKHYRELIPAMDFEKAFFYLDPPYHPDCRKSSNDYMHDFTHEDHVELAAVAHKIKGLAMLSTYDCKAMRDLYPGWYWVKFPIKKNNIRSGEVEECIVMNYNPELIKRNLFN